MKRFASLRFRFTDFFVDHGETSGRVDNVPKEQATFDAIEGMAGDVLEPLYDFNRGHLKITYGFCSPARARLVRAWDTCQSGDQHVGHELDRDWAPICKRLGFAVDIATPSSVATAIHVVENLVWDRIYFYGDDRPLHISVPPLPSRFSNRKPVHIAVDMRNFPQVRPPQRVRGNPADWFRRVGVR